MPKKPMLKFNRIGKPAALKIIGKNFKQKAITSLKGIYGNERPKFFKLMGTQILAIATTPLAKKKYSRVVVSKFNKKKGLFEKFARADFFLDHESIIIVSAGKILKHGKVDLVKKQKTGFNVFRLFLNEAIVYAKRTGAKEIALSAEAPELREYYKRLGFELGRPYCKFRIK